MIKFIVFATIIVLMSGCSWFSRSQPVQVVVQPADRVKLNIELPSPLSINPVSWIVITPENIDSVWAQLNKDRKHAVLFAITSEGYEELALSMSVIRNYIATQRLIIVKYQEYYEPDEN
jgi:hypothetical protein